MILLNFSVMMTINKIHCVSPEILIDSFVIFCFFSSFTVLNHLPFSSFCGSVRRSKMTQQHMTRSAQLKAFQHGLEFQTNQFFTDCFTHAIVNVRGCEIPRNVLHAGTIVVNCGLANFEQSSWSTHRRHEFW